MMRAEIVVVGGGLAGAAAATHLARAGRDVVLVERTTRAQHKVCGEFLSTEALAYLHQLGVDPVGLGAVAFHTVRLCHGTRTSQASLPFAALSLTRHCLDEALLHVAAQAGVRVLRGWTAGQPRRSGGRWQIDGGGGLEGNALFLATGKHDLRGLPRPPGRQGRLVGVKMYLRLRPDQTRAMTGAIELVAFAGGYGGLSCVEGGMANISFLVPRAALQEDTTDPLWPRLQRLLVRQSAHLAQRLEGAEALLPRPLAVAPIPYGFVRRAALGDPSGGDLWALGDQAAVIPSFTGDGMAIALHSAALAAHMYLRGESAEAFQRRLHADVARQVGLATLLSQAMVRFPGPLVAIAGMWPALLTHVARRTRIDASVRLA